jgi:hypothetical protein
VNIINDTDGLVTFGVGYHIWVVAAEDEDILLQGGGPDDGDLFLMQSYRSELGGIAAGITVLGTLSRSVLINIAAATFLCDNESVVLSTNMPLTDVNTSVKAGAQIPHLPLGDDSSPWGR